VFTEPAAEAPAIVEAPTEEAPVAEAPAPQTEIEPVPAVEEAAVASFNYIGTAQPYDGHTIRLTTVGETRTVELWGISGPELVAWPWGPWARAHLDVLVDGEEIGCNEQSAGIARWFIVAGDGLNEIGALLIEAGLAVEDRETTGGIYAEHEEKARSDGSNVWQNWAR
jgi:endonuclease YncB( thermonuclease family)